jgi:HAD superfamily hydrolase (TIGR01509 family)
VSIDRRDVRAVLLDMDGTLIDSDGSVERAWRAWAERYGVTEADAMAAAHGGPAAGTVRRLAPQLSDDEVAEAAQLQLQLQYDDLTGVSAARGAGELLAVLCRRGLPWAVVTSADRRLAAARLRAGGIDPPVLVTDDDVEHGKPHPDGYLAAAAMIGVAPARCLVVEDTAAGISAGTAAGMRVAALRGLAADCSITHLGELAKWLDIDDG